MGLSEQPTEILREAKNGALTVECALDAVSPALNLAPRHLRITPGRRSHRRFVHTFSRARSGGRARQGVSRVAGDRT